MNSGLTATYGEVRLNSGFAPDPHRVSLTAGGSIQASSAAQDCSGMVAAAPDYQITYSAGSLPLVIRTDSSTDTTLLVNGPGGEWYCDDDSGDGSNAQVRLNKPASGVYDIWVGTFGSSTASASLLITELP
ncbi:MAG: peptidase S1 [Alphaproteobacteria bacterium]|nr:MAG: peptidase S1 [Alphaproteobacteria bacterium]